MDWTTLGSTLGGLGLLLLGMGLMTEGLRAAAGRSLYRLLTNWTRSRMRGLWTGAMLTALVQSSSAVTVATIGFVNAGILTLEQSAWVVFGSNVGTTLTGWLVALVGLKVKIELFALPLIGLGMLVRLLRPQARIGSVGEAVAGFGVLFLGLGVLKGSFADLGSAVDLGALEQLGPWRDLAGVGLGLLLTTVMQASSAALVIALTAAMQGLISVELGAAVVIGANLGTTSTALLTTFGATSGAKRVAVLHVAFNLLTAFVALLMIRPLLGLVAVLGSWMGVEPDAAETLAAFHTLFNVLGVLLMVPTAGALLRVLAGRFRSEEERIGKPQHLDPSVLQVPDVATEALRLELRRAQHYIVQLAAQVVAVQRPPEARLIARRDALHRLLLEIGDYAARLSRGKFAQDLAEQLHRCVRVHERQLRMVEQIEDVARIRSELDGVVGSRAPRLEAEFRAAAQAALEAVDVEAPDFDRDQARQQFDRFESRRHAARELAMRDVAEGRLEPEAVWLVLQEIGQVRRLVGQAWKAATGLKSLQQDG